MLEVRVHERRERRADAHFWRDLLAFGGSPGKGGISDPHGRLPNVWFQESGSDEPRPDNA